MILTYKSDVHSIFQKNEDYFAFEVYINLERDYVRYTIVNPYGEIAIYDGSDFKVKKGSLDNMIFLKDDSFNFYTIQLKEIKTLDETCNHIEGIWGAYHDGDKEVEKMIHAIVKNQAEKEGFYLEKVVAV